MQNGKNFAHTNVDALTIGDVKNFRGCLVHVFKHIFSVFKHVFSHTISLIRILKKYKQRYQTAP